MFSRLLLPIDGSESGVRALDHTGRLAKTYDASVHALFVLDDGAPRSTSTLPRRVNRSDRQSNRPARCFGRRRCRC